MFRGDLVAGTTVAIMLIPQGMAYAVLAGLPPVYGLYASLVPLLIYSLLGTSRQLAVGPVALVSLLVFAGVGQLAEPGSDRFIQLAIMTALGAGLVQFLMGLMRMGFIVHFLSRPVLSGFTSAAAIIIGAGQIRNLFGIDIPGSHQLHEVILAAGQNLGGLNLYTTLLGVGSIAAIALLRMWKRTFPSALLVVAIGTALTALLGLHTVGVSIVGDVPKGLPSFEVPGMEWADYRALLPLIVVIALVSYIESIAISKAITSRRGYRVDANQELIALGWSKIGGSFFQSFPTTGGFSRTAVNDQSGATTTVASVITALLIGATVLFLTPLFYFLPNAILAAVIMVAVASLFDGRAMVRLWKTDRKDFAMLMVTFQATLFAGIEEGIIVGVMLSLAMVIYSSTKPHQTEIARLGNSNNFRNIHRYPEAKREEEILIYRFDSSLFFANVDYFRETLAEKIEDHGEALELVILDASAISRIDSTGLHMLKELIRDLRMRRIQFYIASAIGPVRDKLKVSGITDLMGKENFFFDVDGAVSHYRKYGEELPKREFSPTQTNL